MNARSIARRCLLPTLSFLTLATGLAQAKTVWYVKAGGSGNQNGLSWANAMANVDIALAAASTTVDAQGYSDQIWVAEGKYFPPVAGLTSNRFAITWPIEIYGGFKGTETSVAGRQGSFLGTILDGNINNVTLYTDNAIHVVTIAAANYTIVIDGLLIRNGYATGVGPNGAGIECIRTNLNLANCFFQDNFAAPGLNYGGGIYFSSANGATYAFPPYALNMKNCEFTNNHGEQGGAIYGDGIRGAAVNTKFMSSISTASGGAVCITKMSSSYPMSFTNCVFLSNAATGGGTTQAGAIYLGDIPDTPPQPITAGYAQIVNCTFASNSCNSNPPPNGQAIAMSANSQATVDNSIVYSNNSGSGQYLPMDGTITATYSDIEGPWPGITNKHVDPLFVNLGGGNLSLQVTPSASQCIDAADYSKLPADILDLDNDGNTAEITPWDITWVRRVYDQTTVTDTGVGTYTFLDMGAYEVH